MRFYFPDSQDQISPDYDFEAELYPTHRVRQRDDRYGHEVLKGHPYDGLLVSKAMVDGVGDRAGRYSMAQRHRLYRVGVHEFFRLSGSAEGPRLTALADCGAFTYVQDDVPPYTVDEVIDFYEECQFDEGISVDHIVLAFQDDEKPPAEEWVERRKVTLELASEFLHRHKVRRARFDPLGVAQGWSPSSIAESVVELQRMGYSRIAVGGLVPLKTRDIVACLRAIDDVRESNTQLHLLGVTRCEQIAEFARFGATSFDSTSPFRQAFMDETDNFYVADGAYTALRVPQIDGNASLKRRIRAGQIDQASAQALERACMERLAAFDRDDASVEDVVELLGQYEAHWDGKKDRTDRYRATLEASPWKGCECGVCESAGINVAVFRGTERNKRRGLHNIWVFRERLRSALADVR